MINVNEKVTCRNPATGQILQVNAKLYYSIYSEKGFTIVTRDNADAGVVGQRKGNGAKDKSEPASILNSAADLAARMGLTPGSETQDEASPAAAEDGQLPGGGVSAKSQRLSTPAINAENGDAAGGEPKAETKENEIGTNSSSADVSDDRESAKRDRGRGK